MIVKAISHRNPKPSAIKKLITYIFDPSKMKDEKGEQKPIIVKQYIRGYDTQKWTDSFKQNDDQRNYDHVKRTVLRHEIISFSPESTPFLTSDTLKSFAKYYLKHRSPRSLGVSTVHFDCAIHLHFIISSVDIDGHSTRISVKEFKAFKIQLQQYQQQHYPELSHSIVNHGKKKQYSSS